MTLDVRALRPDPSPARTMALLLQVFADAEQSLTRREAEYRAFGVTKTEASNVAVAVGELRRRKLIASADWADRRYVITEAGREALKLAVEMSHPSNRGGA